MKMPHDVDATTIRPKVRKAIAAAVVAVAVTGSGAVSIVNAPPAGAMKMHHDCCIWAETNLR
jgi:hypothetical protein